MGCDWHRLEERIANKKQSFRHASVSPLALQLNPLGFSLGGKEAGAARVREPTAASRLLLPQGQSEGWVGEL